MFDAGTVMCTVGSIKQMIKSTSPLGYPGFQCGKRGRYKYGVREKWGRWISMGEEQCKLVTFFLNLIPCSDHRKSLETRAHIGTEHTQHPDFDF